MRATGAGDKSASGPKGTEAPRLGFGALGAKRADNPACASESELLGSPSLPRRNELPPPPNSQRFDPKRCSAEGLRQRRFAPRLSDGFAVPLSRFGVSGHVLSQGASQQQGGTLSFGRSGAVLCGGAYHSADLPRASPMALRLLSRDLAFRDVY